jgi:hypothetical protein
MLAVAQAKGSGLSPVQLQKSLFLLGKELPTEVGFDFYNFTPHYYGPFDSAIYNDANLLAGIGLVTRSDSGRGFWEYAPTPEGITYAQKLKDAASPKAVAYLEKIVPWAQRLSFSALVRAIYAKYPEFRANSVFQG